MKEEPPSPLSPCCRNERCKVESALTDATYTAAMFALIVGALKRSMHLRSGRVRAPVGGGCKDDGFAGNMIFFSVDGERGGEV